MPTSPTEEQVIEWMSSLSNWGRWGPGDQLGTLNHITPQVRRAAAGLVSEGVSVSCAWDIEATPESGQAMGTAQRSLVGMGWDQSAEGHIPITARLGAAMEFFGLVFHGNTVTHLDGLSHVFWDGRMYNDRPAGEVTPDLGASHHAITAVKDGVVTRGVLLDVAAAQGRDWLEAGEAVFPEDLAAAEERQGVQVRPGDAVLLRTGYGRRKRQADREALDPYSGQAGWSAACLPWIHERDVALIGADMAQDAMPSGYTEILLPVHTVGIVAMGLWLIDNMQLEDLAAKCAELGRWEFQFVLSPLRVIGGTGSPANPLALF